MSNEEYTRELERIVIFMCDVYSKGSDSLAVQVDKNGETDEKWMNVYMAFPTIQGTMNRIYVDRIGALRERRGNREAPALSFEQLYERLKVGRKVNRDKGL